MFSWLQNAPIHRAAVFNFLLFIVPATLLGLHLLLSINHELSVIETSDQPYDFQNEVVNDVGYLRVAFVSIRKLLPSYQEADSFTEYLRDLRLGLILIWLSLAVGGTLVMATLSRKLQAQLSLMNGGIKQLVHHDLSQAISISGAIELREVGQQLDALRLRLQQSEQQQLQFLQHVSHEIKTPLASIREGVKLMGDHLLGEMNSEQAEVTDIILKNSRELQASIESLLDYNEALAQRRDNGRKIISLKALLEEALDRQGLALRAKEISLDLNLADAEATVNPAQMQTVYDNLFSNAIRYSPRAGRLKIDLEVSGELIHLLVQDEGPGIPEEHRLAVFNAFFVGEKPIGDALKGSGLGLSIARQYVELHQGTIEVLDSDCGELSGALLRVCIPNG